MVEQKALSVGESVTSRSARLTRDAAIGFAQEFDPQPMHIDEAAAQDGFFGKLVASGWHAHALAMRLAVETRPFGDAPLIGAELGQIRFTQPILPETDLCVRITFEAIEEGHGQRSYNMLKVETLDAASGDTLIRQRWRMLRT